MRSQILLAQKPKRVGQLANVGAKLINKNETAKLFGNFLSFYNFFAWFPILHSLARLWRVEGGDEEWGDTYTQDSRPVLGYVTPSGLGDGGIYKSHRHALLLKFQSTATKRTGRTGRPK